MCNIQFQPGAPRPTSSIESDLGSFNVISQFSEVTPSTVEEGYTSSGVGTVEPPVARNRTGGFTPVLNALAPQVSPSDPKSTITRQFLKMTTADRDQFLTELLQTQILSKNLPLIKEAIKNKAYVADVAERVHWIVLEIEQSSLNSIICKAPSDTIKNLAYATDLTAFKVEILEMPLVQLIEELGNVQARTEMHLELIRERNEQEYLAPVIQAVNNLTTYLNTALETEQPDE